MKHEGVFGRFVFTLGDAQYHCLEVLTHAEFCRADQVPDVFNHKKIQGIKIKLLKCIPDHIAIQVACASGIDLYDRDPFCRDPLGIPRRLDIALDDPDLKVFLQGPDGLLQQAGLSGAGRTHQIKYQQILFVKNCPVFPGNPLIRFQYVFDNRYFHVWLLCSGYLILDT